MRAFLFIVFLGFASSAFAQEVTIIYTGETHAMLYPCNCPVEPDGGVSRRATIISGLKKEHPQALVLDSGGFFASGVADEYSQNVEIDRVRTDLVLKAMEVMGYDAAAISDDEFNFGVDFLLSRAAGGVPLVSCTLKDPSGKIKPYIIKSAAGVKVAVIGATPVSARGKAVGITLEDAKEALERSVKQAKLEGAAFIVLVSQLGEQDDRIMLSRIEGIDVVVSGQVRGETNPGEMIGQTLYLRPVWQGRKVSVATIKLQDGVLKDFRVDEIRVSSDHADSPRIQAFLPQCFVDSNCRRINPAAVCQNGGTKQSACVVEKGNPVNLTVITSKDCALCSTEEIVNALRERFTGLKVTVLQYSEAKAKSLFNDVGAVGLPVFLLGPEIEKEKNFDALRESLEKKRGQYMIKPQVAGMAFLVSRPLRTGAFDLFIRAHDGRTAGLLEATKPYSPEIHFVTEGEGKPQTEDCLRAVCIRDIFPQAFVPYVACRAQAAGSSWWEDCAVGVDTALVRECARGERGAALLSANMALTNELKVGVAPTYLVDNQQIFSTDKVPTEDELKSIMKR